MNRTLLDKVMCVLSGSGLGKSLWGEAMSNIAFLVNRSPNIAIDLKTSEAKMWSGNKLDLSNLKTFCCAAYAH